MRYKTEYKDVINGHRVRVINTLPGEGEMYTVVMDKDSGGYEEGEIIARAYSETEASEIIFNRAICDAQQILPPTK